MIEARMTARDLRNGRTYFCGYCQIEEAVRYLPRIGYTCGVYGWNCSVYACGDLVIATGYRPAGRWELTREECQKLNEATQKAHEGPSWEIMSEIYGQSAATLAVIAALNEIHEARTSARMKVMQG